jgi:hypothetical protein
MSDMRVRTLSLSCQINGTGRRVRRKSVRQLTTASGLVLCVRVVTISGIYARTSIEQRNLYEGWFGKTFCRSNSERWGAETVIPANLYW